MEKQTGKSTVKNKLQLPGLFALGAPPFEYPPALAPYPNDTISLLSGI